jgi:preprotein translocase subunit SecE
MAVESKVPVSSKSQRKDFTKLFREYKAEVKRITWPSKRDFKKAVLAVVVLCAIYVAYVGVVDVIFQNLFEFVFKIK